MTQFKNLLLILFLSIQVLGAGSYFKGPGLIEGFTTITSAAGTTTLTVASETKQIVTGSTTQTIKLPDATTLPLGRKFLIINKSSGTVTVNDDSSSLVATVLANTQVEVHLRVNGTAAGTWDALASSAASAWGTITGTLSSQTDLQSALNLKAPLASPTFTGTIGTPLTASKLLATDASGNLTATAANSSQATYLDLTSSAQTQLNGKLSTSNYSAKGDLVAGVSSGVVAGLTVGANGKVLTADSNATNGLRWDNPKANKNYVTNWNAEGGVTTGWSTYADAAGTSPVDCTGGTPNSTWAASSSSAIHDSNNFLATLNTGATRQGEGISYAFTVDSGDSPAMMSIRFYYKVAGGTFAAGNDADRTSTGDSDFTVWIYDVTNGTLIQPYTYRLYSNSTTSAEPFVSNFQTNSNSTSYRLCIHKGTSTSVSGTAITVRFDDFEISRSNIALNTPISDWQSYTPTFGAGFGTVSTSSFYSRRVGDSLQVKGKWTNGTVVGSAATITVGYAGSNANVTIDTSKVSTNGIIGTAQTSLTSTTQFGVYPIAPSSNGTAISFTVQNSTTAFGSGAQNGNIIAASASENSVEFSVPIIGWSSSTQVSDGWDARQIVFVGKNTASTSIATTGTYVPFTSQKDSTASWSTDTFTCPSYGDYEVKAGLHGSSTSNYFYAQVDKNGTLYARILQNESRGDRLASGSVIVYNCAAGDTIKLKAYSDTSSQTLNASADLNFITISKLSSPQTMSATEVVAAEYNTTAAQTLVGSYAVNAILFTNKVIDTHNAYNTSTGIYTCPVSGVYEISARIGIASRAWATTDDGYITLYKGSTEIGQRVEQVDTAVTRFVPMQITPQKVVCNAGDTLKVGHIHGPAGSWTLASTGTDRTSNISIKRIK